MNALVLGVGSDWRCDDAAGLEVARRLTDRGARTVDPSRLLDAWAGAREVVVVDAVCSGAAPGTVHRFDARARPLPAGLSGGSTHHLGVAAAIELGRALGRLPERLDVLGIEGGCFEFGDELSPEVAAAVEALAAELGVRLGLRSPSPSRCA